jgi:hypothetical protein
LVGVGVVVTGVVWAGFVGAVVVVDLCVTARKPPTAMTANTSRATTRIWRVLSVAFMAFLSAGPAARVSLKRGIRREEQKERARCPAPSVLQ